MSATWDDPVATWDDVNFSWDGNDLLGVTPRGIAGHIDGVRPVVSLLASRPRTPTLNGERPGLVVLPTMVVPS